jgi:hypothetical protein
MFRRCGLISCNTVRLAFWVMSRWCSGWFWHWLAGVFNIEAGGDGRKPHVTKRDLPEMDLPADKGTYILIARVSQMKRLAIGSLGEFDIIAGFYAYVGSAFGSGGLRARIGHHLESTVERH